MTSSITFTKARGPYGWLSNMSPHPITIATAAVPTAYRTCEHLFQCLCFAPGDPVRGAIVAATSPMQAKQIAARTLSQAVIAPRSAQDVLNMHLVLRCKLREHPTLRAKLLATGDATIIEDVTSRPSVSGLFWGMKREDDNSWRGGNILGALWMELRAELRLESTPGEQLRFDDPILPMQSHTDEGPLNRCGNR